MKYFIQITKISICLFLSTQILITKCEIIECKFIYVKQNFLYEPMYNCKVQNISSLKESKIKVNSITGNHTQNRTNENVTGISINFSPMKCNITKIPEGFEEIFKNINYINIDNTKLAEVTKNDLQVFPMLTQLWLPRNEITKISRDTFDKNNLLKVIVLYENKISHIDTFTFLHLIHLVKLDLDGNQCKNLDTAIGPNVEYLVERIENGGCLGNDKVKEESSTKINENKQDNKHFEFYEKMKFIFIWIFLITAFCGLCKFIYAIYFKKYNLNYFKFF
ncbi:hypothetical protein PVAND_015960 [Polypedilum vanderplanki]|uniref:Leucine-rich repeat protein n=1 Tax=Polypedilum vanderplanki TaxID=319348 RepID=A0A9J6BES9_POLVA|nr:hypothetical protein PVAND_015960 [Polypedilum vanderplanki]